MKFRIDKALLGALLLTGFGISLLLAPISRAYADSSQAQTDKPKEVPSGNPAPPKGQLPVMPAIPVYEQLRKEALPQQIQNQWDDDLTKPQVLANTFIRLLAEKHFSLGDYQKQQEFLRKWLPKIKDLKTNEDADKLNREAMGSLQQRFDYYMSPADKANEESMSNPSTVGIGVTVRLKNLYELMDTLPEKPTAADVEKIMVVTNEHPLVITPFPGSPGLAAGLMDGDIIKEVDGKPITGMPLKDVIAKVKGKQGTKVKLTVERKSNFFDTAKRIVEAVQPTAMGIPLLPKPSIFNVPKVPATGDTFTKTIEVKRQMYIPPVVHVRKLDDGSTLVKLDNYVSATAAPEMLVALTEVAATFRGRLILDLRDNGGGRLDHAINIVQYMLSEGTIVRLRQRESWNMVNIHWTASRDALLNTQQTVWNPANVSYSAAQRILALPESVPIVVLVNGHTASASELTSGALQFHKRAIIVGENTRGKGVGQAVIDLPEGRRTHITTFFFDPAARIIDFEGIHPDVERSLEPEIKKITELRATLRGLLKDKAAHQTKVDALITKLTKLEAEIKSAKDGAADQKNNEAIRKEMEKKTAELVKNQEAFVKEKEGLTKVSAEFDAKLAPVRKELKELHELLENNDPQLQEAQKSVQKEFKRLQSELQKRITQRTKTVEKKTKEWEEEKKHRKAAEKAKAEAGEKAKKEAAEKAKKEQADKSKDSKSKDDKPKDSKPKDDKPKDSKPKDDKPKDSKPKDDKPKSDKSTDEDQDARDSSIETAGKVSV